MRKEVWHKFRMLNDGSDDIEELPVVVEGGIYKKLVLCPIHLILALYICICICIWTTGCHEASLPWWRIRVGSTQSPSPAYLWKEFLFNLWEVFSNIHRYTGEQSPAYLWQFSQLKKGVLLVTDHIHRYTGENSPAYLTGTTCQPAWWNRDCWWQIIYHWWQWRGSYWKSARPAWILRTIGFLAFASKYGKTSFKCLIKIFPNCLLSNI